MQKPRSWQNNLVTIVANETTVTLSWLRLNPSGSTLYTLNAHVSIEPDQPLFIGTKLYNITAFKHLIQDFIDRHAIRNPGICVAPASVDVESIVALPKATPSDADFSWSRTKDLAWEYQYLYPQDDNLFAFYVCGMKQQVLLQYTLLGYALDIPLRVLMPRRMALLHLYQHLQGPTFRHAQLAAAMHHHHHAIESLISRETIYRVITIAPHVSLAQPHQAPDLCVAVGLALTTLTEKTL